MYENLHKHIRNICVLHVNIYSPVLAVEQSMRNWIPVNKLICYISTKWLET